MSQYQFISGYDSYDKWCASIRRLISMGEFRGSVLPVCHVEEGEALAERERLYAEIVATETPVEREETKEEFYMRMVKRDATVRRLMRANGMEPPTKETHDEWYENRGDWIDNQPGMDEWNYPLWLDEEGRSVALREKLEDQLRDSGEMSPKRASQLNYDITIHEIETGHPRYIRSLLPSWFDDYECNISPCLTYLLLNSGLDCPTAS